MKKGDFIKINNAIDDFIMCGVPTGITWRYGMVIDENVETRPDCVLCRFFNINGDESGFDICEKEKSEVIFTKEQIETYAYDDYDDDEIPYLKGRLLKKWKEYFL